MPFVQGLRRRLVAGEREGSVFQRTLPFMEVEILEAMKPGIIKTTGAREVIVVRVTGGEQKGLPLQAQQAVPGQPGLVFENIE
jgi:leucyl-tRNA synthetase